MRPDHEIAEGIRMGAIAVVSAVVTATLVIGAGRALMPATNEAHAEPRAEPRSRTAVEVPVVRANLP